jgi:Met-zincin
VFMAPEWIVNDDVLRRIEGVGMVERMRRFQVGGANRMLDPQRMYRIMEAELQQGEDTFTMSDLFGGLRSGIFGDVRSGGALNLYQRNLQRGYVERLQYLMENEPPSPPSIFVTLFGYTRTDVSQSDIRPYIRGELETIGADVARGATRTGDELTRLHLVDMQARIDDILDTDD